MDVHDGAHSPPARIRISIYKSNAMSPSGSYLTLIHLRSRFLKILSARNCTPETRPFIYGHGLGNALTKLLDTPRDEEPPRII